MTQTKKYWSAYSIAGISVLSSFVFWTKIVENNIVEYAFTQQGSIWQGTIRDSLEALFIPSQASTVALHGAAAVEPSQLVESITASVVSDVSKTEQAPAVVSDLTNWEIQYAYSLQIPRLDIDVPVLLPSTKYWNQRDWNMLETQMQIGLANGSVAYPHSSVPGENGTLIVAGHSSPPDDRARSSAYGSMFSRLPELEAGDEIIVHVRGEPVIYAVESATVVPSTATQILEQQNSESILKVITCFPVGTTKDRLVVTAKRVGLRNL